MAKPDAYDFYCDEVLTGKTPVKKLYESEKVLAFLHTRPAFKTHIVIIPKTHIHDLLSPKIDDPLILEIISVARKLAKDLDIEKNGARLITNLGLFQDTPHLHFHLVSGSKQTVEQNVHRQRGS